MRVDALSCQEEGQCQGIEETLVLRGKGQRAQAVEDRDRGVEVQRLIAADWFALSAAVFDPPGDRMQRTEPEP
jgi:hypothetical protein